MCKRILLTTEEVAGLLGLSKHTIYRMVKENNIPHVRIGNKNIFFQKESIYNWLDIKEREFVKE